MAQRSNVPQFGNWEGRDNISYTEYFDKARKGRTGGKIINPTDPQENPDSVACYSAPATPSRAHSQSEEPAGRGAARWAHERGYSSEDNGLKQFANSAVRNGNVNRRVGNELAPFLHPDKGAAVPKFGDWDESNPASGDEYTQIFNKVREERLTGATRLPSRPTESSHGSGRPFSTSDGKGCCFAWCR